MEYFDSLFKIISSHFVNKSQKSTTLDHKVATKSSNQ